MREIKVRFWDDIHNKFWYGGQEGEGIGNKSFQTYFKDGSLVGLILETVSYGFKDVDDYQEHRLISSQYTGLKDMHGKEIYEGDVLSSVSSYQKETGYVVFDEGAFCLKIIASKTTSAGSKYFLSTCKELEVIGNQFENPELLERDCIHCNGKGFNGLDYCSQCNQREVIRDV